MRKLEEPQRSVKCGHVKSRTTSQNGNAAFIRWHVSFGQLLVTFSNDEFLHLVTRAGIGGTHAHTKAQTKHTLPALKPNWFSCRPGGGRCLSTEAYSSSWKTVFITMALKTRRDGHFPTAHRFIKSADIQRSGAELLRHR